MRLTRPSSSPAAAQRLARSLPQLPRTHAARSEARQRAQLRVAAAPAAKPAAAPPPAKPTPPAKDRWHKPAAATADAAEGSSAAPAAPAPRSNGATSSGDDDWPAQTGVLLIKCDDSKGVVASVAQVGAAAHLICLLGAGCWRRAGRLGRPASIRACCRTRAPGWRVLWLETRAACHFLALPFLAWSVRGSAAALLQPASCTLPHTACRCSLLHLLPCSCSLALAATSCPLTSSQQWRRTCSIRCALLGAAQRVLAVGSCVQSAGSRRRWPQRQRWAAPTFCRPSASTLLPLLFSCVSSAQRVVFDYSDMLVGPGNTGGWAAAAAAAPLRLPLPLLPPLLLPPLLPLPCPLLAVSAPPVLH